MKVSLGERCGSDIFAPFGNRIDREVVRPKPVLQHVILLECCNKLLRAASLGVFEEVLSDA